MKVIILSGVSGSGKTFYARKLLADVPLLPRFGSGSQRNGIVLSASDYMGRDFIVDPKVLGKAHGQCLSEFVEHINCGTGLIIIDNTNTTVAEIAPYYALAEAFGYEAEIITIDYNWERAWERNVHQVPKMLVGQQAQRIAARKLPGRWKHKHQGQIYTERPSAARLA